MGDAPIGVIGSGVAGLVAALTVVSAGRDCVLFEAQSRLGGCCATLDADGDMLEPAASVVIGAGMLSEVLNPLDMDVRHLLQPVDPVVRIAWPGGAFALRGTIDALSDEVAAVSPADAARVEAFVRKGLAVAGTLVARLWDWKLGRGVRRVALLASAGWAGMSYSSLLARSFTHPRVCELLASFSDFYAGVPASQAPAFIAILPAMAVGEGCFAVRGGIQRLPECLAARIVRRGGDIRTDEAVRRIVIERGAVRALETTRRLIPVAGVVAACDIRRTLDMLPITGRLAVPRWWVGALRPSVRCISVLGIADSYTALPPMTWVLPLQPGARGAGAQETLLPLAAVSQVDAARGGRGVRIGGAMRGASRDEPLDSLANRLTEFARAAEVPVRLRASWVWGPQQYDEHLGLPGGAAFGFAGSRWQLGPLRYGPRSPLPNLTVAGQSCFPGFGIPLAALSGRMAATLLLRT